jgi:hypothetical protein
MRRSALVTAAVAAVVFGAAGTASAAPAGTVTAAAAAGGSHADFNGDGYPDLAIGAHTAAVSDVQRAGVVAVAYGSATGLRYDTAQIVSQATPGVPGDAVTDGKWREATAAGDLDGDGFDDLVIHWVDKNTVLWGSKEGLTGAATVLPAGNQPRLLGGGIGIGDVNGDGVDDFVSRAIYGSYQGGGSSYGAAVLLGPLDRATGKAAGTWYRASDRLDDLVIGTVFVGDLTGDGIADVVTSGYKVLGSGAPAGTVLKGSPAGLVKGSTFPAPYVYDGGHHASAFADLDKDGYQDLVTGHAERNQIFVTYGGPNGVSTTRTSRSYQQGSSGVPGMNETGDKFGSSLAVGDTNKDGYPDIAVGIPYETGLDDVNTKESGAIDVLWGSPAGVSTVGAKGFTQNAKGIPSTSEAGDHFGSALALLDSNRDGATELYVGGNGEDGYKGRVWNLATDASGVTGTGATSFSLGTLGGPSGGGNFGYRMAG